MKQSTPHAERRSKKPYVKPEMKQVSLRPEEAVLGGCKVPGTNAPANQPATRRPPAARKRLRLTRAPDGCRHHDGGGVR